MPDLLDFAITPLSSVSVNLPRVSIAARIIADDHATVLADYTGANALIFPAVIGTLTAAERMTLARLIAVWLLRQKAGLLDPLTGL